MDWTMTNMRRFSLWFPTGVGAALLAAVLFGASTPLAKALLEGVGPWLLAGSLYLGSGLGLALWRLARRSPGARLAPGDSPWLAGAIVAGGVVGPVLLLFGLTGIPASGALMATGVWLHLSERHEHWHEHDELEHEHDLHHDHHPPGEAPAGRHTHRHRHVRMAHAHAHYPDEHHRHTH